VSPVLAAFVRGYNDALDDARRQDLLRVAAALVGTVGDAAIEDERRALCDAWSRALWARVADALAPAPALRGSRSRRRGRGPRHSAPGARRRPCAARQGAGVRRGARGGRTIGQPANL
jgi:hypothetical protein